MIYKYIISDTRGSTVTYCTIDIHAGNHHKESEDLAKRISNEIEKTIKSQDIMIEKSVIIEVKNKIIE